MTTHANLADARCVELANQLGSAGVKLLAHMPTSQQRGLDFAWQMNPDAFTLILEMLSKAKDRHDARYLKGNG